MPDLSEHIEIINNNFSALSHLANPECGKYTDWCSIIIFYMALHYIHAYLDTNSKNHPTSHISTEKCIKDDPQLKSLYDKYRHLQDDSNDARYLGNKISIYLMRITTLKWFSDIQDHILSLLDDKFEKKDLYPLFPSN